MPNMMTDSVPAPVLIPTHLAYRSRGRSQYLGYNESEGNHAVKPVTPHFLKQHVFQTVNLSDISTSSYDAIPEKRSVTESIYFSVKTTQENHSTRLLVLLQTWMKTVLPSQVQ
jgi:hypothetical protein